jgi:transposase
MANNIREGQRPRQRRTDEEKRRIVEETLAAEASVSVVARRHDVNANQVFAWRRQYQRGELGGGAALIPVGVIGAGGLVSSVSDLTKPQPAQPSEPHAEPMPIAVIPKQPKMIEVELRGGTKIRIDADVKGSALQQVLKLIRSLA